MALVALEGMQFYAFHGYYDFERRIGNSFVVDVEVDIDMHQDPDDKIENTINYEEIYKVSTRYMQKNYQLLESLAYDLAYDIKNNYDKVKSVKVCLSKLNPPVGGKVNRAKVTVSL